MTLNTSGINFSGLASGLDTDTIIQKLLSLQQRPLSRLTSQQTELKYQLSVMEQFKSRVSALQASAGSLVGKTAFSSVSGSSSDEKIATVATTSQAAQGTYNLEVKQLAQAQKIGSKAFTDSTSELSISGTFLINNKAVTVSETDSLSTIAGKINNAGAGVTASILNGGSGKTYLTLTSNNSGVDNKMLISDVGSGTVAKQGLELISLAEYVRRSTEDNTGMYSANFLVRTEPLGSSLNLPSPPPSSMSLKVDGVDVPGGIDFNTDTLETIATKLNGIAPGVTAQVEEVTVDGAKKYRIKLSGATQPVLTDDNNIFKNLGLLTDDTDSHQLVAAKNAVFTVDGMAEEFQSQSNTITDVIPGAIVKLLKANETTPEKVTISLTRDVTAMKGMVNSFVSSFNALIDFVDQNSKFDSKTYSTGYLFGNTVASNVRNTIISQSTSIIDGLQSDMDTFAEIGITLTSENKLTLDDSKLQTALLKDPSAVSALFQIVGTPSRNEVQFISGSNATKVSSSGYLVNITQAATKAQVKGAEVFSTPLTENETLTFSGKVFGGNSVELNLGKGQSLSYVVDTINNDYRLKDYVVASAEGNKLVFTAKRYGSNYGFNVSSNRAAEVGSTGVGAELTAVGKDVAGTIGGESATGSGQYLTGATGNTNTDGLQIMVTATAPGLYGNVKFTRGIAQVMSDFLTAVSTSNTGDIASHNSTLQDKIDSIDKQKERLQALINSQELILREKFSKLEEAMSKLQSQSSKLSSIISAMNTQK